MILDKSVKNWFLQQNLISGLSTAVAWRPTASPATMWGAWNNSATVSPWMLEQPSPGSLFGLSGEFQETCGPGA
jgi:hypothetical protein